MLIPDLISLQLHIGKCKILAAIHLSDQDMVFHPAPLVSPLRNRGISGSHFYAKVAGHGTEVTASNVNVFH